MLLWINLEKQRLIESKGARVYRCLKSLPITRQIDHITVDEEAGQSSITVDNASTTRLGSLVGSTVRLHQTHGLCWVVPWGLACAVLQASENAWVLSARPCYVKAYAKLTMQMGLLIHEGNSQKDLLWKRHQIMIPLSKQTQMFASSQFESLSASNCDEMFTSTLRTCEKWKKLMEESRGFCFNWWLLNELTTWKLSQMIWSSSELSVQIRPGSGSTSQDLLIFIRFQIVCSYKKLLKKKTKNLLFLCIDKPTNCRRQLPR